ncbi:hypothetical protein NUW58_g9995 [Xylaria curta]|uniref:Uncharacterized protein n=1 Tax=Xylaria curta TaxID=42375 RepID=A0ACC1MST3_9PEZI|nr:hypothetical protein NUW58_g9995 [Xylaria curta]
MVESETPCSRMFGGWRAGYRSTNPVCRVPAPADAVLQSTNPSPCGIVVLISGDIADQYSDKHLLTMALFAIPQRAREEQTFVDEGGAQGALHIRVVILKQVLDEHIQMRITEFLSSTTGKVCSGSTQATPDKDALQLRFDTWDGLKTSNGGLEGSFVVSDGTKDLGDILRENGASIVLKPMDGTDD